MTSATTTPPRGAHGRRVEGHGYGLVLVAAILLLVAGCFNLVDGIAAIANSHVFVAHVHYVFGNLRTWGRITLIFGALQTVGWSGCWRPTRWPAGSRWPSSDPALSARCFHSQVGRVGLEPTTDGL